MVAPGFLANLEVRRYLNGVEPAWTMLDLASFNSLRHEPSVANKAIRLERNLAEPALSRSAVTKVARMLLGRAGDPGGGLKLTSTGNLSRAVVTEMVKIIEWPGLDKTELLQFHKVINEPDFFPVHFVRCSCRRRSWYEHSATGWSGSGNNPVYRPPPRTGSGRN